MSHPVNDEILERLYEEVFEERSISPECDDPVILFDINKEVRRRFEELSQWISQEIKLI